MSTGEQCWALMSSAAMCVWGEARMEVVCVGGGGSGYCVFAQKGGWAWFKLVFKP